MMQIKIWNTFFRRIDSSLRSAILDKHGDPSIYLNINHVKKDRSEIKFSLFSKYINKKLR